MPGIMHEKSWHKIDKGWRIYAINLLKKEMKNAGVNFPTLAIRVGLDYQTLIRRMQRKNFSAGFFFQVMAALEVDNINLLDIKKVDSSDTLN